MIGNEHDALLIRDWYLSNKVEDWDYNGPDAPEGWQRLGSGIARVAYLSPDGVVYKVERHYNDAWAQSNTSEFKRLCKKRLTKMPERCRLPKFNLFELDDKPVMAMEHFPTLLRDLSRHERFLVNVYVDQLSRVLGAWDVHDGNFGYDEKTKEVVMIDCA